MAFILNFILFGGIIYTYNMKTDIPEMPDEEFTNNSYKNDYFIKNKVSKYKINNQYNLIEEFNNHMTYPNIQSLRRY